MNVDTTYSPPVADIDRVRSRALIAGVVGLAGCGIGLLVDRDHFFRAWLVAYMLFLGIALGSLALMMVQHLSGGVWGVFRRIFEASSRTLPLLVVLFVPVLLGIGTLYPWSHADHVATDEVLRHKSAYLNPTFFVVRAVIYFAGWWGIATLLNKWSRLQDSGDLAVNTRIQRLSGAGLVFYALAITFAGVDWIMSLNPHWYSTIFGFLMMGGQGLAALAFTIIVSTFLFKHEPMSGLLKPHHFHDLGKLMFAFVMLWAYFNFSQYLLTFAANLVEEIPYMITRTSNGWQYLAIFLVTFHFFVPWLLLLSRNLKRTPYRLVVIARLDPVHALRRSLHDGVAGVRRYRRQPALARRRTREPLLRALARPRCTARDRWTVALDVLRRVASSDRCWQPAIRICGNRSKPREGPLMAHDPHAAHASADDEYLNPAAGSGHEHTDANVSMIVQFAVWLTASAVIVHILMWFTFAVFVNLRENKARRSSRWPSTGTTAAGGPATSAETC